MVEVPVKIYIHNIAKKAREAVRPMALLTAPVKDKALRAMADKLAAAEEAILDANREDTETVGKALQAGDMRKDLVREAVDRLRLSSDSIKEMVEGLRRVADLPDPVGEVTRMWQRPNGMEVSRVRVPIGVIGIVSELDPKVMVEAFALCLKSGNVCMFRSAPEWIRTNMAIVHALRDAAEGAGVPAGALTFVERTEKEGALELMRLHTLLDAFIPRGGPGLRKTALDQVRVPVLCHEGGVSTVYVDVDVDLPLAQNLVINAKLQQPLASNSVDTLLVQQTTARPLLPALIRRLIEEFKVDIHGCPKTVALIGSQAMTGHKSVEPVTEEHWSKQFQAKALAVKMVADVDEALAHIARYGPAHTCSIATRDYATAMRFAREVDAAAVLINASTRHHDGEEFGFGGQMGIATGRVHARGPIGLNELTCEKYVVLGTGQLRQPHPVPDTYEDAIMLRKGLA
ncbi:MAG: glutamate-5-semialdehyde dehydrogenase [Nitrospira sp.]|nr:glutamate-5-semialdehyde dehydrogenase [Nitrospira sp.]